MISYKEAGVDIDAGNSFVEAIKPLVGATSNEHCMVESARFLGLLPCQLAATTCFSNLAMTDKTTRLPRLS